MSEKLKAEAYVRERLKKELMELSFGCEVRSNNRGCRTYFTGRNQEEDETYYIDQDQIGTEDEPFAMDGESKRTIIGHPIHLQHWLRVLHSYRLLTEGEEYFSGHYVPAGQLLMWHEKGGCIFFNLTTGSPATEKDYKAFNEICGI